tara:strand:- start:749 stop:1768 length:1020 start_codon:yes stop_codon:yes gene_type:complete
MVSTSSLEASQVICLGEALVDRIGPIGGEILNCDLCEDYLGGAPANVACALARLGINISFIGRLGNDDIGKSFHDLMSCREINLKGLQIDSLRPSRVVLVKRDNNGERSFQGFDGDEGAGFADQFLKLNQIIEIWNELSNRVQWLSVGTISLATTFSSESLIWCVENAVSKGIKIALDINWRPKFWDLELDASSGPSDIALNSIKSLLKKVSFLKLAKEEAIWFFQTSDPLEISMSLPSKPHVVITNGGMKIHWCLNNLVGETSPVKAISIVDTTGAGDAFTAGLLHQLVSHTEMPTDLGKLNEMVRFAAACGAIVCRSSGAIAPQPNVNEVRQFLSRL